MNYFQEGDRVVNDDGYVAIRYYTTIPQTVSLGDKNYLFSVRANICMAWIPPEYANKVLSIKKDCGCANSNPKLVYHLATLDHVRRWSNGGGR